MVYSSLKKVLGLIFLQMVRLYKDPKGEEVFLSERAATATRHTLPFLSLSGTDQEIQQLRKRVLELEDKIAREQVSWIQ